MSLLKNPITRPNYSSNITSRWRRLQNNNNERSNINSTHIRGEPLFNNIFGDRPGWIDPATTLRGLSHNVQGIRPIANDDKLQSGLANMVLLQSRITCLTETNVEWSKYGYRQCFKDGFNKIYAASRHIFSSSSEIASDSYHKRGSMLISATDRWTHIVHLSGEDSTGAGIWSYFTLLRKMSI
jgi:hypothetical protein